MRILTVKLGELDPHDNADCWFIWLCAVGEFLWPTSKHDAERDRLAGHVMFHSWCSEMGDRQGVIDGLLNFLYPEYPSLDLYYGREADRHSRAGKPGGIAIASELDQIWEKSWASLLMPRQKGSPPSPQKRQAARGLKLCLLTLVLRLGVFDGAGAFDGRRRLVTWADAVDAASLQLALSVFWTMENGENADFNPPVLPWDEIKGMAAKKLSSSTENPRELKGHAAQEGMEGYRKRLRASMDATAFRRVALLAAEFERQGLSGLDKWRKESLLDRWFVVGRV